MRKEIVYPVGHTAPTTTERLARCAEALRDERARVAHLARRCVDLQRARPTARIRRWTRWVLWVLFRWRSRPVTWLVILGYCLLALLVTAGGEGKESL